MGIETFFFISLAVTFLLLVALVYHFHQKFVTLDQRVNNVIEIINSVVKEMQNLKQVKCCLVPPPPPPPSFYATECINISPDSFIQSNVSLGNISEVPTDIRISSNNHEGDDDDDEDEDDDDDDDDEDDNNDFYDESYSDSEKIVVSDDEDNDVVLENIVEIENDQEEMKKDLEDSTISIISNTDYKKMDITQLRAIVNAKGIDAKKMKKADLLKVLEE